MKKYSLFHPYVMAFFSKALYRDVGQNWGGIGALYLLILLAICWIPTIYSLHVQGDYIVSNVLTPVVKQLPQIVIKNGKLSVDKPMPFVIKDEKTHKPVIVIDTSGKVTTLEQAKAPVLITASKVIVSQPEKDEIKIYKLNEIPDMSIGQERILTILSNTQQWLMFALYPIILFLGYLYRLVQGLVYGAIGMIFVSMLRVRINYQQSVRLAIIAMTPAIILATLFDIFVVSFPLQLPFYFVVSMAYLFFAIKSNRYIEEDESP